MGDKRGERALFRPDRRLGRVKRVDRLENSSPVLLPRCSAFETAALNAKNGRDGRLTRTAQQRYEAGKIRKGIACVRCGMSTCAQVPRHTCTYVRVPYLRKSSSVDRCVFRIIARKYLILSVSLSLLPSLTYLYLALLR